MGKNESRLPTTYTVENPWEPGLSDRIYEAGWARKPRSGRIFRIASEHGSFSRGDVLLVRTERGDIHVRSEGDSKREVLSEGAWSKVIRHLDAADFDKAMERDRIREDEARTVFINEVRRHDLEMHLSEVEVTQGDNRVIFYFTAPGRVDFRGLVRDLAGGLKTRIELRQIGVRDEARSTGGIGPCGQPLCCATFLRDFTAVTIRMAKTQGLVPNPQKVSGLCGRLMCCLAYEHDVYLDLIKAFPKVGARVMTPKGEGKVRDLMVMRGAVKVSLGPGVFADFQLEEIKVLRDTGTAQGDLDDVSESADFEEQDELYVGPAEDRGGDGEGSGHDVVTQSEDGDRDRGGEDGSGGRNRGRRSRRNRKSDD